MWGDPVKRVKDWIGDYKTNRGTIYENNGMIVKVSDK